MRCICKRLRRSHQSHWERNVSARNDGGPAFPIPGDQADADFNGLTLRDYFAAHAPEPPKGWHGGDRSIRDVVEWHWRYADAMLAERAK